MEAAGKRHVWHTSRTDEFRVWNLSDLHLGARGCSEKLLNKDVKAIAEDPYSFWIGGGDYAEFIGYSDKRFDPDAVADWISVKDLGDLGKRTMQKVRDVLYPIRSKCLGLLIGNHERKFELHTQHESLHYWLCEELGVPYLGYCCLFDLHFCLLSGSVAKPRLMKKLPPRRGNIRHQDSNVFRVFAHHGAGYAVTPGGKLNKLISAMNAFEADLYFLSHVHDQMARREPVLSADAACTTLTQKVRLGMISGSYLKTYNQGSISYGEQKMYRPTSLGAAVAKIRPATRHMEAAV